MSITSTTAAPLLELRHVSVMRGARYALQDVSLQIGAGEHVAILGPNGSGKSTLLKLITRECYPLVQAGTAIRILGHERWNVFELRRMLGIVSGDLMQANTGHLSGIEVVLSGFFSSVGIWRQDVTAAMRRKAEDTLALLGVPHLAERPTAEMSSGEARRVLIARALVNDAPALLLDEPMTALDPAVHAQLRDLLRTLARRGIGIVMITHQVADLIPEIERVVCLKSGRIVADGASRTILNERMLSELFGASLRLVEKDGFYALW